MTFAFPQPKDPFALPPNPAQSYDSAVLRARSFDSGETRTLQTAGRTRLYTHGQRTKRAVVLFHGITNHPQQWEAFGKELFEDGWNVLIPRLPQHGHVNLLTDSPGRLTAKAMVRYTADAIDIAAGLGDEVRVVGLSAGGVYTGWAAQHRSDVAQAVLIAPFFGIYRYPIVVSRVLSEVCQRAANQMMWWDAKEKFGLPPPHAYPKFSTRGLAATLELGTWVHQQARRSAPSCPDIVLINNGADTSVENSISDAVSRSWQRHGANVREFCLDASLKIPHDCIDITQPTGKTELVYAKLRELMGC